MAFDGIRVVEDEPVVAQNLQQTLREMGHASTAKFSGMSDVEFPQ